MFEIVTKAVINTDVNNLWSCLINTNDYKSWNIFIREIKGKLQEGEKLEIELHFANKEKMLIKPICTKIVEKRNKVGSNIMA